MSTNTAVADNTVEYPLEEAITLCEENYLYCAVPNGVKFPNVEGIPIEWYTFTGQLEFRKYQTKVKKCETCKQHIGTTPPPYTGWMVSPVVYTYSYPPSPTNEKRYPQFQMKDEDVLWLWMKIVKKGGCVSDGIINLFG